MKIKTNCICCISSAYVTDQNWTLFRSIYLHINNCFNHIIVHCYSYLLYTFVRILIDIDLTITHYNQSII